MSKPSPPVVIRPLELKHLFDFAIRLYRFNFLPLFLSQAMVQLPLALLGLPFILSWTAMMRRMGDLQASGDYNSTAMFDDLSAVVWLIVFLFGGAVYQLLVLPLGELMSAKIAVEGLHGVRWSLAEAFAFARSRYWPTQVALATYFLPLVIGSLVILVLVLALQTTGDSAAMLSVLFLAMMLILAGLVGTFVMAVRFFPALMGVLQSAEEPQAEGAWRQGLWYLSRAYGLTSSYYWRLAGLWLLVLFAIGFVSDGITSAINLLAQLVEMGLAHEGTMRDILDQISRPASAATQGFSYALASLVALVFHPLHSTFGVLLYYDLRCRKEAYDLYYLLEQEPAVPLAVPDPAPAVPPASPDQYG